MASLGKFLQDVLPLNNTDGYSLVYKNQFVKGGKKVTTFPYYHTGGTVQELVGDVKGAVSGSNTDVYFASASYEPSKSRHAKNVRQKKCFYVDIDYNDAADTHKRYSTVRDVVLAITKFCDSIGAPYTYLVHTGNGIHAYWVLDTAITANDWLPIAKALDKCGLERGLGHDSGITVDVARILRLPESKNHKDPTNIKDVKILKYTGKTYTTTEVRQLFKVQNIALINPSVAQLSPELAAKFGGSQIVSEEDTTPKYFSEVIKDCAAFNEVLHTGGEGISENHWYNILLTPARCVDGDEYPHKLSEGHKDYDYDETQTKWEHIVEGTEGTTTCAVLGQCKPSACASCPHKGIIKSPIQLGTAQAKVPVVSLGGVVTSILLPSPYVLLDNGSTGVTKKGDDGVTTTEHAFVGTVSQPKLFEVLQPRSLGGISASVPAFSFLWTHKSAKVSILLTDAALDDTRAFNSAISKQGLALRSDQENKHIRGLYMAWRSQLSSSGLTQRVSRSVGWVQDGRSRGFTVGDTTMWHDGVKTVNDNVEEPMAIATMSKGNLDDWRKSVELATSCGHVETNVMIAASFGAPLIGMFGVDGGVLSAISKASGTGKTTACSLGLSVWGKPKDMLLNLTSDTAASMLDRMASLRNLPVLCDEALVNVEDWKRLSQLKANIFAASNGKEPARLDRSARARPVRTFKTIVMLTSNTSVVNTFAEASAGATDAVAQRVLEFEMPRLPKGAISTGFDPMDTTELNYGVAGLPYAKYLVEHHDDAQKLCTQIKKKIGGGSEVEASNRFLVATAGSVIAGAMIAKQLGIVDLDVQAVYKFTTTLLNTTISAINDPATKYIRSDEEMAIDILGDYLAEFEPLSIVVKDFAFGQGSPAAGVDDNLVSKPRNEDAAIRYYRASTVDVAVRISPNMLRKWAEGSKRGSELAAVRRICNSEKPEHRNVSNRKLKPIAGAQRGSYYNISAGDWASELFN